MRLTTDKPSDYNMTIALNLFYVKDRETWVRGGGEAPNYPDVTLYEFTRRIIKAHDAKVFYDYMKDNEELSDALYEALYDGPETIGGLIATLYTAGCAFSEIREKLKHYEDSGFPCIRQDDLKTLYRAVNTYGQQAQVDMAIEEMSELTKALLKQRRATNNDDEVGEAQAVINIYEEIADVFVMLAQLIIMYPQPERIEDIVRGKIKRLKERLDSNTDKDRED